MAEDEKEQSGSAKKSRGLLKLILLIIIVILLISGGIFAYFTFFSGDSAPGQQSVQPAQGMGEAAPVTRSSGEAGVMYDLPSFVVNLADPAASRYLRVSISVEVPAKNSKLLAELDQKLPRIKDTIITVLSAKTYEEITTPQGKISLKQELLRRINSALVNGRLADVYLTEFVVQ